MSVTHDFKFQAPDGKLRTADALDAECMQALDKKLTLQTRQNSLVKWKRMCSKSCCAIWRT